MPESIVLTVLVENTVYSRGLLAEHGLAVHIQAGKRGLLFDTGQTDLLMRNGRELGVDLAITEAVVLSHGHDDHTGGLTSLIKAAPKAKVVLHPAALSPKFVRKPDGTVRSLGMCQTTAQLLRNQGNKVTQVTKPTEVLDGIFVTGQIPRRNGFEGTGGDFFLDAESVQRDPVLDDQALFFDTARGLVVLFGCAHAGVLNTLDYILLLTGGRPVRAIVGGLHLGTASPEQMDQTLATFRRLDIQQLAPGHCTGVLAVSQLNTVLPGVFCLVPLAGECGSKGKELHHQMNSGKPSKLDKALARVCVRCPVCRNARRRQKGAAFWLTSNVELKLCPFCRAYQRVYGRSAHKPV